MPLSFPLRGRGGKPSRSASSIVVDSARGRHDLKIDAMSFAAGALAAARRFVTSSSFTVGGYRWRIRYYPNGDRAESAGHISLFLELDEEDVAGKVRVAFQFTLVSETRAAFFRSKRKELQSMPPSSNLFSNQQKTLGYPKFTKRDALPPNLSGRKGDSIIIRCQLTVITDVRTVEKGAPKSKANSIPVPPPDLHRHLGGLLENKQGADVVFDVGGETFTAHRIVLAARSPVFAAELFSEMKESEAEGVIRIEDMEPGVFRALLCFAYTDSLPDIKKGEEDAMYQHLLVAADRYGMERLKLMCENKLSKHISVSTAATILTLAEQHHCDGLKKACLRFLSAPANLRAVAATEGFEHLSTSCPSIKKDLMQIIASQ